MITQIRLSTPPCTYLRDPQGTALGNTIIRASIMLIDEIGFEAFTFKKLASRISSTEASVYRYFENKHQLLLFLYAWYWDWMNDRLKQETRKLENTRLKLEAAFRLLLNTTDYDEQFSFVDEEKLKRIIEQEGIKSILTKNIASVNGEGAFENYKQLVETIAGWITELNPGFPYPNMFVTTVIEGSHLQHFFVKHLPRLTNKAPQQDSVEDFFMLLIEVFIFQTPQNENPLATTK